MIPARIVAIDGSDVDVKPLISVRSGIGNRELPLIPAVPFISFAFSGSGLFVKPAVDMDVLICCAEVSCDGYLTLADYAIAQDGRKFDLTDAFVISGVNTYIAEKDVELRANSGGSVTIDSGIVEINEGSNHAVSFEQLQDAWNLLITEVTAIATIAGAKPPTNTLFDLCKVEKVKL